MVERAKLPDGRLAWGNVESNRSDVGHVRQRGGTGLGYLIGEDGFRKGYGDGGG